MPIDNPGDSAASGLTIAGVAGLAVSLATTAAAGVWKLRAMLRADRASDDASWFEKANAIAAEQKAKIAQLERRLADLADENRAQAVTIERITVQLYYVREWARGRGLGEPPADPPTGTHPALPPADRGAPK